MRPMVITATMMRAREAEPPLWNSSHELAGPGFWASISAAISTIRPPQGRPQPGESWAGRRAALCAARGSEKEAQHPALTLCGCCPARHPTAVLIRVGQREQRSPSAPR